VQSGGRVFGHVGPARLATVWETSGRYRDLGAEHHVGPAKLRARSSASRSVRPACMPVVELSQPTRLPARNPPATAHSSRMATIDGNASAYSTRQNTTAGARLNLNKASVCARHGRVSAPQPADRSGAAQGSTWSGTTWPTAGPERLDDDRVHHSSVQRVDAEAGCDRVESPLSVTATRRPTAAVEAILLAALRAQFCIRKRRYRNQGTPRDWSSALATNAQDRFAAFDPSTTLSAE
jgi:hypothetical protein